MSLSIRSKASNLFFKDYVIKEKRIDLCIDGLGFYFFI